MAWNFNVGSIHLRSALAFNFREGGALYARDCAFGFSFACVCACGRQLTRFRVCEIGC